MSYRSSPPPFPQSGLSGEEEDFENDEEKEEDDFLNEHLELLLQNPAIKSAFCEGVDLKQYTDGVYSQLHQLEVESVKQYNEEKTNFSELYNELTDCDAILASMETTLGGFQHQLATATTQIKEMQVMCVEYLTKLDNRKAVEKLLNKFLNEMTLPSNLVRTIETGKVNQQWVQYLLYFDQKVDFIESLDKNIVCVKEQRDSIISLTNQACTKINQWLISKIAGPQEKRSVESLQRRQIALRKYTFLFKFLKKRDMAKAKEVVDFYIQTVSTLYYTYFQRYCNLIDALQYDVATKNDLLGESEHSIKEFFTSRISKNRPSFFSLGTRSEILANFESPFLFPEPSPPNVPPASVPTALATSSSVKDRSLSKEVKYHYEYMYRAINYLFLDLVLAESAFCKEFFKHDMSDRVLGRTVALLTANLQKYLSGSHDVIGAIIIQAFIHSYKHQLHSRGNHNVDSYFDNLSSHIKNRVKQVMDLHIESVKSAVPIFLGSIDWKSPHYVTRRYSEFLSSVLRLKTHHSEALKGLDLELSLKSLRLEIINLLNQLSDATPPDKKNLFLINNYALVNTLSKEHNIISIETEYFEKLLETEAEKFQEGQLIKYFSKLLTFVKTHSSKDKTGKLTATQPNVDIKIIEDILKSFTQNNYWKESLSKINEIIMQNFPNFLTGRMIFYKVLSNMFLYYSLLSDIINQYYKDLKNSEYFIPIIEMRYKIKELTPAED